MIDNNKPKSILNNDPELKAIFSDVTNQVFFTKLVDEKLYNEITRIIKGIPAIFKDPKNEQFKEKTISLLDELRNVLFREGICFDDSCLKNIAYDLDEVILNENWNVMTEIASRLEYRKNHGGKCQGCQFKLKNGYDDSTPFEEKIIVDKYFKLNGFKTKKMELSN